MGLDTVELVMAIEEEFSIPIPDEAAAKMVTVGDIYEYVRQFNSSPALPLRTRKFGDDYKKLWFGN